MPVHGQEALNICHSYMTAFFKTIILRNRAEYHLILSRRVRRPSWLNQGIFRKIEHDILFYYSTGYIVLLFNTAKWNLFFYIGYPAQN